MNVNRRDLIIGAGFATAAPALVKAKDFSFLEIPGDPLSARGLMAASKWATDVFNELPACRMVFANGDTTRWHHYQAMSRAAGDGRTYAVAIECCVTDDNGQRFITSVPVNGAKLDAGSRDRVARQAAAWASVMRDMVDDYDMGPPPPMPSFNDFELPF